MIITESLFEQPLNVLTEERDGKKQLYIEGCFAVAETRNRNSRIYPRAVLAEAVEEFQKKISDGSGWGELGHQDTPQLDMAKVSHRILSLDWDKDNPNNVVGRAVVLDEGAGKVLSSILRSGGKIGVSTRGVGKTKKAKNGTLIVESPFKLISCDVVLEPSTDQYVESILESCGDDPETVQILAEVFCESAKFDAAYSEYLKRKPLPMPKSPRAKRSQQPQSKRDVLSGWMRRNGNRNLANLISDPVETLARVVHLGGLYRVLKRAHEAAKGSRKHPHIDTEPEVDDEFGPGKRSRFWEYRIELAKQEMDRRRRNKNEGKTNFGKYR